MLPPVSYLTFRTFEMTVPWDYRGNMRKTLFNNLRETFGACPWPGPASRGSDSPVRGREPAATCPLQGRDTWRKREGWQTASGKVHSEYSEECSRWRNECKQEHRAEASWGLHLLERKSSLWAAVQGSGPELESSALLPQCVECH